MKLCKYCQREQPDEAFEVCAVINGKSYRRLKCKTCKQARKNARRQELRRWVETQKQQFVCIRCGYADFRALEFHHADGANKEYNIGDMVKMGLSRTAILREMSKCVVLCSNCHRIEHYERYEEAR